MKSSFPSFSQGAMSFMNRTKAVSSANMMNQRIKTGKTTQRPLQNNSTHSLYRHYYYITQQNLFTEPPNYYRPPGVARQNQPVYYNKGLASCPMMPHQSETPAPGALNHWTGQVTNPTGPNNGVGLQQVNPSPSMPTAGENGNSLPLLTSMDLEILQPNGPTTSQPRQDLLNQQVQQSQQPPQRQGLERTWFNYGSQQPQNTQNGASGTSGSLATGYPFTSSLEDDIFQSLMGNHQPGIQLKQEPQGLSNMAPLGNSSSDCVQSFTALLNCNNGSSPEHMRQIDPNGSNQRVSQIQYPSGNMGQESHLEHYAWHFPE